MPAKKKPEKRGPKTKLTDEARVKLKHAAALDASVEEMAYYCGVSRQTLHNWKKEDRELFDEIERLRQKPVLAAREAAVKKATESYNNAIDYLSRKRKTEFSNRQELTGADGGPVQLTGVEINIRE